MIARDTYLDRTNTYSLHLRLVQVVSDILKTFRSTRTYHWFLIDDASLLHDLSNHLSVMIAERCVTHPQIAFHRLPFFHLGTVFVDWFEIHEIFVHKVLVYQAESSLVFTSSVGENHILILAIYIVVCDIL